MDEYNRGIMAGIEMIFKLAKFKGNDRDGYRAYFLEDEALRAMERILTGEQLPCSLLQEQQIENQTDAPNESTEPIAEN